MHYIVCLFLCYILALLLFVLDGIANVDLPTTEFTNIAFCFLDTVTRFCIIWIVVLTIILLGIAIHRDHDRCCFDSGD